MASAQVDVAPLAEETTELGLTTKEKLEDSNEQSEEVVVHDDDDEKANEEEEDEIPFTIDEKAATLEAKDDEDDHDHDHDHDEEDEIIDEE